MESQSFPIEKMRGQVVRLFWSNYWSFIRSTKQHILEYPLNQANRLILQQSPDWNILKLLLLPFNPLRPLILLIAWDQLGASSFVARRNLINAVWVSKKRAEILLPVEYTGECREP